MGTDAKPVRSVLMDAREVYTLLGVTKETWHRRVRVGQAPLPFTRMGNFAYYRRADIRHFLRMGRWPAGMKFVGMPAEADD
jgi:predicted DNA-binding transcriptional regulator AlpA